MVTEKDVIDMYIHLRKTNMSIPDEALDFMKKVCLEKLSALNDKPCDKTICQIPFADSFTKAQMIMLELSRAGLFLDDKLMQAVTVSLNCINDETEKNILVTNYLSGFTYDVLFSSIKSLIDEKLSEFKYVIVRQVESGVTATPFESK